MRHATALRDRAIRRPTIAIGRRHSFPKSVVITRKERFMFGVFVSFRYGDGFDEQALRKIAETARTRFEGMPGLRS
jgi:hypothetical protein